MKKLLAITGVILVIYLLASVTLTPPPAVTGEAASVQRRPLYTVREYEGYVAVFPDGGKPKLTDTAAASLPKSDRIRLEKGIEIFSEKELKELLEDLCS